MAIPTADENDGRKFCPCCRTLVPIETLKKFVSRSSGRNTTSWRCDACLNRKLPSKKASK